jgi:hypothetical protein
MAKETKWRPPYLPLAKKTTLFGKKQRDLEEKRKRM